MAVNLKSIHWIIFLSRFFLLVVWVCYFLPCNVPGDDFWDWKYRMKITLTGYTPPNATETLTNFPMLVVLDTNINGFAYCQFRSESGGDLRFQDADENTVLNFEIEHWDTNGSSSVWVQLPAISSSNDYFWAYWGSVDTNSPPCITNGCVWGDTYAGVWHLKENGFPYQDSTAAHHDGTNGVVPSYTNAGVIGPAQFFNGSLQQKIDIQYTSQLNTNVHTVSFWANVSGSNWTYRSPLTSRDDSPQRGFMFYADITNKWGFWQGSGSGWSSVMGANVSNGVWTYVAGTYDGSNMWLSVDGMSYGPLAMTLSLNTARPLRIGAGASESAGAYWFNGIVDEVRVESIVRSTNWLWSCMMSQGFNGMFATYGRIETRIRGTVIIIN
ncbi:MAG: hypothetical protein A2283_10350 [Lentisphaerae bacterium RIFOXYA12_FULL_48_11]|nr:MAG: hypothetical protein A2283_10350 [Lentisphaerae bacterium RIFOXYA12_FULL_48_11]